MLGWKNSVNNDRSKIFNYLTWDGWGIERYARKVAKILSCRVKPGCQLRNSFQIIENIQKYLNDFLCY